MSAIDPTSASRPSRLTRASRPPRLTHHAAGARLRAARCTAAVLGVGVGLAALAGCNTARILAPPPPLRASSAATFAVDVEFAEPLSKSSAEDVSHYVLAPAGSGSPVVIASATLVDTLNGQVVQLLVPDWLGADPDGTDWTLSTSGVLTVYGRTTGNHSVTFRAGLSYAAPLKSFFNTRCGSCHGASRADGSYRTDSHPGLLGNGTDGTANLIAGDVTCLLIRKCKPHNSMFNLAELTYFDFEMIRNWVVSYNARP